MKKAIVFGTAAFAEVARVYLDADSPYTVVAFSVHEQYIGQKRELLGLPICSFETLFKEYPPSEVEVFVALGFSRLNKVRASIVDEVKALGFTSLAT